MSEQSSGLQVRKKSGLKPPRIEHFCVVVRDTTHCEDEELQLKDGTHVLVLPGEAKKSPTFKRLRTRLEGDGRGDWVKVEYFDDDGQQVHRYVDTRDLRPETPIKVKETANYKSKYFQLSEGERVRVLGKATQASSFMRKAIECQIPVPQWEHWVKVQRIDGGGKLYSQIRYVDGRNLSESQVVVASSRAGKLSNKQTARLVVFYFTSHIQTG